MCKDIFLDRTSKTTYNHLAYMFSFTFIVNIHISKYIVVKKENTYEYSALRAFYL